MDQSASLIDILTNAHAQASAEEDRQAVALGDYWEFCRHVQTWYEDPDTRRVYRKPYPTDWSLLHKYHESYNNAYENRQDFVCVKGRRLLATYDPLIDWLFRATVHSLADGPVWLMAVLRQSENDAKLLIERVQGIFDLLPPYVKGEVSKRTTEEFRIGDCILRALHAKGDAGRGEPWNRVLFDEHAFQERGELNWNSFAAAMQKMSVSTPNGENHFKDLAVRDTPSVVVYDLGWEQHPERDEVWAAEQRARLGEKVWLVEHCRRFDVYAETGLFSDDFHEDCVVDVVPGTEGKHFNWDGESPIIVSFDPGKVDGAGVMVRYFNADLQDIRLASFYRQGLDTDELAAEVCEYCLSHWPQADYKITGDPAAQQERAIGNRYNEHSDQLIIQRVCSQKLARCEYDEEGRCVSGSPLGMRFDRIPQGQGSRKKRHQLQRVGFRLRHDGRRGTLIVKSENVEFLKGCRGAYKLPPHASPRQMEYETPDRSMPCVHVMDADGCGLSQFSEGIGAAITKPSHMYDPRDAGKRRVPTTRNAVTRLYKRWTAGRKSKGPSIKRVR